MFLGFRLGFTALMSLGQSVGHPKTASSMITLVLIDLGSSKSHKTCIWTSTLNNMKMDHLDLVLKSTRSKMLLGLDLWLNIFGSNGLREAKMSEHMHLDMKFVFCRKWSP